MTRDEYLRELQRRIAERMGWRQVHAFGEDGPLFGTPPGRTTDTPDRIPLYPWDWCAAGELVEEMEGGRAAYAWQIRGETDNDRTTGVPRCSFTAFGDRVAPWSGKGASPAEAIARCWLTWKGVDLSDLPPVAP